MLKRSLVEQQIGDYELSAHPIKAISHGNSQSLSQPLTFLRSPRRATAEWQTSVAAQNASLSRIEWNPGNDADSLTQTNHDESNIANQLT